MPNEAAAILAHYLKQLALRNGLRWTAANDRDMQRLAMLLDLSGEAPADCIPPYQAERTTVVLEQTDPGFEQWRQRRREEDEAAVGRMIGRNGGGQ